MLDLLPLIKEGDQEPSFQARANDFEPAQPSNASLDYAQATPSARNEPSGNQAGWSDQGSDAYSDQKSSGLLAKYKAMRKRNKLRRSEGGDPTGSHCAEDFSPLMNGDSMRRLSLNGDSSSKEPSPSKEQKESTLMAKMKAYRKRSKSGSGELREIGPLEAGAGMNSGQTGGQHANGHQRDTAGGARQKLQQSDAEMQQFFDRVSEAKALLARVVQQQKHIEAERVGARLLVVPAEIQAAQRRTQEEISEITRLCKEVKGKLDAIDSLHAQVLSEDQEADEDNERLQLQLSVMAGLNAKMAKVIKSWQDMQSQWHEEDLQDVGRQLHTVTGRHYSEEELEESLDNGGAETLYRQALTQHVSGATVQKVMKDVKERHEQFRQLEASMLELHQVFLDMSILVADQGDMLDSIDNWVNTTAMTMQQSLRQLRAAKASRKKAATTKAWTFVTGVGLVAGGAGLTATGAGAIAGVPMMIAGGAAIGGSAIGGIT